MSLPSPVPDRTRFAVAAALLALSALAGCAPPGPYPSLEPRPIEKALADTEEPPAEAPLPDEAGLPARIAALTAEVRRGEREFDAASPAARAAAERAGGVESESWIEAQQALSRLEAAGAVSGKALADMDALAMAEEQSRRVSAGDLARLHEAVSAAQAVVDAQGAVIERIKGKLGD
ncbi:MAG TPA: hypothetical protein VIT45_16140 [Allosphingosinicella sp.]